MSRTAFDKTRTYIRREISESVSWEDGKITEKEFTKQEYLPPNKEKWLVDSDYEGEKSKTEIIYIGSIEYRRVDSGKWTKTDKSKPEGGPKIPAVENETERSEKITYTLSKPTSEKGVETVLEYRSNLAFSYYPGVHVREIFLDKLGRIVRIEENAMKETDIKEIVHKSITTYEYDITDIKIEAPIK